MAGVTIPSKFEDNFALGDGGKGHDLKEAFQFKSDHVDNLYTWDSGSATFKFSFQEKGVAYEETAPSTMAVVTELEGNDTPAFKLQFSPVPLEEWGINFAGTVVVKQSDDKERKIYMPGTRTYDPAGKSGDPHASERIGPSCSRTQNAITLAQLMAAMYGVDQSSIAKLQEKLRPMVNKYHGRETLFDWMFLQITEVVFEKKEVTPYPEFIKACISSKRLDLPASRDHTRSYLMSYNRGSAMPPVEYYKKVAQKDPLDELLTKEDLEKVNKLTST